MRELILVQRIMWMETSLQMHLNAVHILYVRAYIQIVFSRTEDDDMYLTDHHVSINAC